MNVLIAGLPAKGERTEMSTKIAETQENKQVASPAKEPKAPKKANAGAQKPRVAPAKGKTGKKATSAKKGPHAPTTARKAKTERNARAGSKTAKVVDLLRRKGGASLSEIVKATGWQKHSVRGFISGALGKKLGLTVESTKGDDGDRNYSVKG
jgi:hypothetical protein